MIRLSLIVSLVIVTITAASAQSWFPPRHQHHRHHIRHIPHLAPHYDPMFCQDIITAFNQLPVRDLDAFVKSVPDNKRAQALRCLTRGGR